jgi:1-acyl-sn-glycerol-3-phosphate acyltransferase
MQTASSMQSASITAVRGSASMPRLPSVRDAVYPPVIILARGLFAALGLRFSIEGAHNVPRQGGAVLASNHVSYLDFAFVGYGTRDVGRLVRFMAKESVFRHPVSGPLMRGMHHIPVDRAAGSTAFREAMTMLKAGELVGVFPEATISRSFELKEFKPGAVRMAQAAGVPLVPTIVWGGQRIYTKGRRPHVRGRGKAITVAFGEPLTPSRRDTADAVTAELVDRMRALLERVQRTYPQRPAGDDDRWWLPAAMGGTAPTPQQAKTLDAAEAAARRPEPSTGAGPAEE